ncbi:MULTISPECIES: hypothetical protein [Rhizobium]|uniref:hypothetical protein n=1 Tax=Rhizobium TaxID=379 RepID=UPI001C83D8DA|nr:MULTISPECIES: hypothetical protein [Rhizobium]MBX4899253.1 hypothetical protein [Rhizobium bangladeshense]MBX5297429.1 hypothetical protein [Rhizobium sp. NLR15a]MBY3617470.1 hypothetical protein [Rhizobium bangladeshense]
MESNRIYFEGNPWPEGHPIKELLWSAKEIDGEVWFDIHLESANYNSERDIKDKESSNYTSDWDAPYSWENYQSCILSSDDWHNGGFRICSKDEYTPEFLDGLELLIDPHPETITDRNDFAFQIYLLGHDTVAKHKIKFDRIGNSNRFKITWSGKIGRTYVGDHDFKYNFSVMVTSADFPQLPETL